jgi:hypothetical protein
MNSKGVTIKKSITTFCNHHGLFMDRSIVDASTKRSAFTCRHRSSLTLDNT